MCLRIQIGKNLVSKSLIFNIHIQHTEIQTRNTKSIQPYAFCRNILSWKKYFGNDSSVQFFNVSKINNLCKSKMLSAKWLNYYCSLHAVTNLIVLLFIVNRTLYSENGVFIEKCTSQDISIQFYLICKWQMVRTYIIILE